jgi:hypothetical protein
MNFLNTYIMYMQERGKKKPPKKKASPTWGEIKKIKNMWRLCMGGGPETAGSTLGSPSKMLDMSALAHVTVEELYWFVQRRLIEIDGESFTHAKHALPKGILHEIFPSTTTDWRSWNSGHANETEQIWLT